MSPLPSLVPRDWLMELLAASLRGTGLTEPEVQRLAHAELVVAEHKAETLMRDMVRRFKTEDGAELARDLKQ